MTQTHTAGLKNRSGCLWAFKVLLAIMLGGAIAIGAFTAWLSNAIARSEGATNALQRAAAAPAVIAKLGAPVTRGMFATGNYSINYNGTGAIEMSLPVSGPKGGATLEIVGTRTNTTWSYKRLTVVPADGSAEIPVD